MNTLESAFVYDLIILTVPLLFTSVCIRIFKRFVSCSVSPRVSRETKKSAKSWCYDE